jgi:transposase-like protein
MSNTIDRLRRLSAEGMDFDDAVSLYADAKTLAATYAEFGATPPAIVTDGIRVLDRAIREKMRDELERKLSAAKARRERLATPAEQRDQAEREIAALEAQLGVSGNATQTAAPQQ